MGQAVVCAEAGPVRTRSGHASLVLETDDGKDGQNCKRKIHYLQTMFFGASKLKCTLCVKKRNLE